MTMDLCEDLADVACRTLRPLGEVVRHHILEGVLRRVAGSPHAGRFVLRGSMLTRLWAPTRAAQDLDFAGAEILSVEETAQHFREALRDAPFDDGLRFDGAAFRARGIWQDTEFPGVRLFLRAGLGEPDLGLQIDVGFRDPFVPPPELVKYPALAGPPIRAWCCRPETMLGWKLHGLAELGERRWRPKDLHDLLLIGERPDLDADALALAIASAFTSRHYRVADAVAVFDPASWWAEKRAQARWDDFRRAADLPDIPENVARVAARVAARLRPALERLKPREPAA
jgi:hypothetical protein